MKKAKKYDAVQEVREIREKLSVKYFDNPDKLLEDLKAARKKFFKKQPKPKAV
ncbi:hypothetical protein [Chitinophaga sp.]|uniref:hypothetical protein n=1 Tax=Chitinophaga sp. TaxID=1869181 RepID=UPI0031E40E31